MLCSGIYVNMASEALSSMASRFTWQAILDHIRGYREVPESYVGLPPGLREKPRQ